MFHFNLFLYLNRSKHTQRYEIAYQCVLLPFVHTQEPNNQISPDSHTKYRKRAIYSSFFSAHFSKLVFFRFAGSPNPSSTHATTGSIPIAPIL